MSRSGWSTASSGSAAPAAAALNVEQLRRTFTRESVHPFWSRVISGQGKTGRPCPCCRNVMTVVALAEQPGAPNVDVCRLCHFVWFDAGELEGMQPLPAPGEKAKLSGVEREARALARVAGTAFEAERPESYAWWIQLIRFFGTWI